MPCVKKSVEKLRFFSLSCRWIDGNLTGMRRFILMAWAWVSLVGGLHAASETSDRVIHGLLRLGQSALEHELDRREAQNTANAAAEAQTTQPKKRTWADRGADMVGTFIGTATDELGKRSSSEVLAFSVKDALDVFIDEYKEQYKKEGREYAKELGDRMVERVREDPKISSTLTAIEILCWSIIVYLTLVTVFVFSSFVALRRGNKKLRRNFAELEQKFDALRQETATAHQKEHQGAVTR